MYTTVEGLLFHFQKFEALARRLFQTLDRQMSQMSRSKTARRFVVAVAYFRDYPLWYEMAKYLPPSPDRTEKEAALASFHDIHEVAVRRLMEQAELLGLDSRPLHESAIVCRRLYPDISRGLSHDGATVFGASWPDCLHPPAGPGLLALPPRIQDAVLSGDSLLKRMEVLQELGRGGPGPDPRLGDDLTETEASVMVAVGELLPEGYGLVRAEEVQAKSGFGRTVTYEALNSLTGKGALRHVRGKGYGPRSSGGIRGRPAG